MIHISNKKDQPKPFRMIASMTFISGMGRIYKNNGYRCRRENYNKYIVYAEDGWRIAMKADEFHRCFKPPVKKMKRK